MPNLKSKILISFFFVLLLTPVVPVRAQTGVLRSVINDLSESVDKVKEKDALDVRKEALRKILDFSINRIEDFQTRLAGLDGLSSDYVLLQDFYLEKLNEFLSYYKEKLAVLESEADVKNLKKLAADIKLWREEIYNPAAEKIIDFLLVFRGEDFLNLAISRLDRVTGDVNRLKDPNLNKKFRLQSLLAMARENLSNAKNFIASAKAELLAPTEADIEDLAGDALREIKSAYQKFIEINLSHRFF